MILVLDNYDSFTYNLVQYLGQIDSNIKVIRNDEITLKEVTELNPSRIIISPGPGRPEDTGIVPGVIDHFSKKEVPVLGVCLGHQAIGLVFGASVIKADRLMHGKISTINHDEVGIYEGVSQNFEATRYHSLIIDKESVPMFLKITASTDEGEIMGIRHRNYPVEGVQFHPESLKTFEGKKILYNFVKEGVNCDERSVGN
ncbi:anthranilate synthase component II [Natranaerofaba carboxydovora]|uniref:anthranilate synthase component II n=1 Tax=Natranaerofaba carboxydovora TaxID=2742683 RepID=UPI001F1313A8|nr:aminodeoxychorismate/anthranilate synthase component II [Natranaerofaba carboxydovora]UMZ72604.1 Aminodeoxychorismate/anthranilate synthase component 2 [Natranaerofaba carboxydovora]